MRPSKLTKVLGLAPNEFSRIARKLFDWYPDEKSVKRQGVKHIIFNYKECAEVAKHLDIKPTLFSLDKQSKDIIQKSKPANPIISPRSCAVGILGHADHGKTSFLDSTCELYKNEALPTNRVNEEAGKITQKLYPIQITLDKENPYSKITFIDSPGQEIFKGLRDSAGAVADFLIIVIALDEGILSQTKEVLSLALESRMPIMLLFTKKDLVDYDSALDNLKNQLSTDFNLQFSNIKPGVEKVMYKPNKALKGRSTISSFPTYAISISSKTKENLPIVLSYLKEFVSESKFETGDAVVIDSTIDGRGNIAEVLINSGSFKIGDHIVCSGKYGRIKGIQDNLKNNLTIANAGDIIQIMAFSELPAIGEFVQGFPDKEFAKELAEQRKLKLDFALQNRISRSDFKTMDKKLTSDANNPKKVKLDKISEFIEEEETSTLKKLTVPVVIKAESMSALDVILDYISSLSKNVHSRERLDSTISHDLIFKDKTINEVKAKIEIVNGSVGEVSQTDLNIAQAVEVFDGDRIVKNACPIYYYGSRKPSPKIIKFAKSKGLTIKYYDVMPLLLDDLCNVANYYKKTEIEKIKSL